MSESKILKIVKNDTVTPSNDLVIQRLEEALAMAKDGNVQSCAIVCTTYDHSVVDCWASGGDVFRLLGGIESLKLEFMLNQIER